MAETKIVSKLKNAVATVTTARKKKRGGERYKLHRISRAGTYGFHYTPTMNGTYNVELKGTKKDGVELIFDIPLYVGTWPPLTSLQKRKHIRLQPKAQARADVSWPQNRNENDYD